MFSQILEKRKDKAGAVFDRTGQYRYLLFREFEKGEGTVAFVMLNPHRADETKNDPTITRCARFAQDWGFARLEVTNLFALCARTPREFLLADDPVGNLNESYLHRSLSSVDQIIIAWGNYGGYLNRSREFLELAASYKTRLYCLAKNKSGEPKHPLYVSKRTRPKEYFTGV